MTRSALRRALLAASLVIAVPALADQMIGGAPMSPGSTIIDDIGKSSDHDRFVGAIQSAGLVQTLRDAGPYTVFAPTDAAFAKLPLGTMDKLLEPANLSRLATLLSYHVVEGRMTSQDIAAAIKAGHGRAELKTLQGEPLTATMKRGKLLLTGAKGGKATVTIKDVAQSNGLVDVVDAVLMP